MKKDEMYQRGYVYVGAELAAELQRARNRLVTETPALAALSKSQLVKLLLNTGIAELAPASEAAA